ncbi:hypothetical protein NDK47_13200 [Brevibacillus ruminantium]|uniref:AtpZ/AtpI family protein n=1 Tax=Brevibacillus ruminantium TaxID=2950604 RepID=A0ABY4WNA9_9BACL|nr:hypothetical protein [Brevibacillus ruminantium]USG68174.1 hypothetical protein NDK47_13200 [Brevibacillus ruminantium]
MFDQYSNKYAVWVQITAKLVLVLGFIGGVLLWLMDDIHHPFRLFVPILSSIVVGVFLYGFAEIIEILYRIYKRLEENDQAPLFSRKG